MYVKRLSSHLLSLRREISWIEVGIKISSKEFRCDLFRKTTSPAKKCTKILSPITSDHLKVYLSLFYQQ